MTNIIIEAVYGLGRHVWVVPLWQQMVHLKVGTTRTPDRPNADFTKLLYAVILIYNVAMNIVKLSFILLYRRIFSTPRMTFFCNCSLVFIGIWTVVQALILSFACIPLSIIIPNMANHCLAALPVWYSAAIIATIIDFAIFIIPLPSVTYLRMRTRQKLMIAGMFGLGFL